MTEAEKTARAAGKARKAAAGPRKAGAAPRKAGAAPRNAAAKGAAKPRARMAEPAPITTPVEGGVLKTSELVTRVAARSGLDKKASKLAVTAVLAEIDAALGRGETFVLQPMGRAVLPKGKDGAEPSSTTVRLRRGGGKKGAKAADESDT